VLLVALVVYLSGVGKEQQVLQTLGLPAFAEKIYLYVDSCVKQVSPPALQIWGKQSGYANPPVDAISHPQGKSAVYFDKGKDLMPTQEKMLEEGAKIIQEQVEACVQQHEFEGVSVVPTKAQAILIVTDNNIAIKLGYPMTIAKGTETIMLDKPYNLVIPIRLKNILLGAASIVTMEKKDPKNIDLTLLLEQDIDVKITPLNSTLLLYSLIDQQSNIKEEHFMWMFANKLV
jgi:hypothetical protein